MKSPLLFLNLFLITITSFGQVNFEKGYFISNDGRRIDCFIKNQYWNNNPTKFFYKLDEKDTIEKASIQSVKEFCIEGKSKFIRADVKIDRSGDNALEINYEKEPVWTNDQLFLRVLVEGKANLYLYKENSMIRYFYSVNDSSIQQLIYKKFLVDVKKEGITLNAIKYNLGFRQQLWNDLKCSKQGGSFLVSLDYKQSQLERFFNNYNNCNENTAIALEPKKQEDDFDLKVTPGLNYSSFLSESLSPFNNGKKLDYRIGIETEFKLHTFNRSKVTFLFEPTYQYVRYQADVSNIVTFEVTFGAIEFPIGLRYSFLVSKNLKLFVNAHYIPNLTFTFNSFIRSPLIDSYNISFKSSTAFGGGISYKRYSAELRYYTNRGIITDESLISMNYRRMAIILGYKLF